MLLLVEENRDKNRWCVCRLYEYTRCAISLLGWHNSRELSDGSTASRGRLLGATVCVVTLLLACVASDLPGRHRRICRRLDRSDCRPPAGDLRVRLILVSTCQAALVGGMVARTVEVTVKLLGSRNARVSPRR